MRGDVAGVVTAIELSRRTYRTIVQNLFWARLPGDTLIILGTVIYAADLVRKRFVLRASESDPEIEDMAVAEGVLDDD